MEQKKISILLIEDHQKEERWWIAQGLEFNIAAQAKTIEDAVYSFFQTLASETVIYHEKGKNFFKDASPAPEFYWKLFNQKSALLKLDSLPRFSTPKVDLDNREPELRIQYA